MQKCPVCEKSLEDTLPPFCGQCGWDLKNDLTLAVFIGDIPESVMEEYRGRLAAARRNWTEKAEMAQKLRELEQRLDESEKRRKEEKAEAEKNLKEALAKNNQKKASESNWIEPVTGIEFVFVPGGTFMMGDVLGDGDNDEKPVHEVTLDDFYIGKFPVTQEQWKKVMGNNPSRFPRGRLSKLFRWYAYPVENVSWRDAMSFIEKLEAMSGKEFRFDLPTEAQWEYAARSGGKKERYAGGEDIDALAWHIGNSGGSTRPVGQKQPNDLGLYDMSGNVLEWCRDWYGNYPSGAVGNPVGSDNGADWVNRGGAWFNSARDCRSASRGHASPDGRLDGLGFRVLADRRRASGK